jgi:hypothetical protein
LPIFINTEQELRRSDGTQVPEPRMVTDIPDVFDDIGSTFFSQGIMLLAHWQGQSAVIPSINQ